MMLTPNFDYKSYLILAKELALCDACEVNLRVAKWRSSISRAYYAAFLSARCYQPDSGIGHGDLIAWVRKQDADLAEDLKELKTFREDCDYDYRIRYDLGSKAQECCDLSEDIITRLVELFGNLGSD